MTPRGRARLSESLNCLNEHWRLSILEPLKPHDGELPLHSPHPHLLTLLLCLLALPRLVTLAELQGAYSTCLKIPRPKKKEPANADSRAKLTAKSAANHLRLSREHKGSFKCGSQPPGRDGAYSQPSEPVLPW